MERGVGCRSQVAVILACGNAVHHPSLRHSLSLRVDPMFAHSLANALFLSSPGISNTGLGGLRGVGHKLLRAAGSSVVPSCHRQRPRTLSFVLNNRSPVCFVISVWSVNELRTERTGDLEGSLGVSHSSGFPRERREYWARGRMKRDDMQSTWFAGGNHQTPVSSLPRVRSL